MSPPPLRLTLKLRHGLLAAGSGSEPHSFVIGIRPVLPDASIPEDVILVRIVPLGVQWHRLSVFAGLHQVFEHFKNQKGEASPGNAANDEKFPLPWEIVETESELELRPSVVEELPEGGFSYMALG